MYELRPICPNVNPRHVCNGYGVRLPITGLDCPIADLYYVSSVLHLYIVMLTQSYDGVQASDYETMVLRPINRYLSVCGFLTGKQSTVDTAWVETPNKASNKEIK